MHHVVLSVVLIIQLVDSGFVGCFTPMLRGIMKSGGKTWYNFMRVVYVVFVDGAWIVFIHGS